MIFAKLVLFCVLASLSIKRKERSNDEILASEESLCWEPRWKENVAIVQRVGQWRKRKDVLGQFPSLGGQSSFLASRVVEAAVEEGCS